MNNGVIIAVIAVVAVAGIGGGAFVLMSNGGDDATTYSVTYDLDGGTGTAPVQKALEDGETFTVAKCDATKAGFNFAGWSDGEKTYQPDADYKIAAKAVVLKAIWEVASYTVTAPLSSAGYEVTAQNATVGYNESYTFTVSVADKYNGDVAVTASGTHGTITTAKNGNTTTVTIPGIASDISSITLSGITELGIGTHFDYVITGTWSYNAQDGTVEGSSSYKYVAQNSEEMLFTETTVLRTMQGTNVINESDNSDDPKFIYGNLDYANYCLNTSLMTPAGTAVVVTTDGQKTLNKYTLVDGTMTYTYFVDLSSNIMYKMTAVGTKNSVTMNTAYELGTYEILSEDPYTPSEKLTQREVASVTGSYESKEFAGTVTDLYWAEAPEQHVVKTTWDVKYTSDSTNFRVGDIYNLEDNDDDDEPLIPAGAVRGADVTMMTFNGEQTLQVWTYTDDDGADVTLYVGTYNGEQMAYKAEYVDTANSLTMVMTITEIVMVG